MMKNWSAHLHGIFEQAKNGRVILCISIITISEVLNALDKVRNRRIISDSECQIIANVILSDIVELTEQGRMEIHEVKPFIIRESWDLILKNHLSAIDAIQVITARMSSADIFLAADRYLLSQMQEIGLKTWNVEENS
jgi:predicted nucleic acid-binding protein